jgi:long-subunit acyl-CoA synthetase (AMP-forming)
LAGHRGDAAIAWADEMPPASANATAPAQAQLRLPERMDISALVAALPCKKAAIFTLEDGALVERAFTRLHADCVNARDMLRKWGVSAGSRVGVYAPNSYLWLVFDLALIAIGAISIAFTEDFRGQIDDVLLDRYDIALLLTSKTVDTQFPGRPHYVAFLDSNEPQDHVQVRHRTPAQHEQDQLSWVFSSGSAGGLKGLVISRLGVSESLPPILEAVGMRKSDRLLLFLPMSNFQQRFLCYGALWNDFDIILTDYHQLFAAMRKADPTVLLAPPIFYQMLHAEFLNQPGWKKVFPLALGRLLSLLPAPQFRLAMARRLFAGFYRQFGSRIRLLITGMAPMRTGVLDFFDRMQLPLSEAYGMVEAGVITYRPAQAGGAATVGRPLRGVQLSVSEDGEVVVSRQHPVTLRYFQCADGENERTFLGSGRIATGDIGQIGPDGRLTLLGRKTELIVTPSGYKVHPEIIEHELNICPDIANSVVFLDQAEQLRCVVSLNNPADETAKIRVRQFASSLRTASKVTRHLGIVFSESPFTRENGMLRPNMKIDRKNIVSRYGSI